MAMILCVEDDPDMQQMLKFILTEAGFEVAIAHHGKAGIDMARELKPDLILMDIMMPDISGIQAIKRIKSDPDGQDITIIVVSAYAGPKLGQEALEAGASICLPKSGEPGELIATIRRSL